MYNKKNKRAWVRIIEAFTAILLLGAILIAVLNQTNINKDNKDIRVSKEEQGILRAIEINDSLRNELLGSSLNTEITNGKNVYNEIEKRKPRYLNCTSMICSLDNSCTMENIDEEIYAQTLFISSNLTLYSPRKLVLFCWRK